MSHFYAQIPTSARKTMPTARGHKTTGVTAEACSWAGKVSIEFHYNINTDKDEFTVYMKPHHGRGDSRVICDGIVGESDSLIQR